MERIIKFRAWDTEKKKMYPVDEFTCNWRRNFNTCTSELVIKKDNILMQFTGLYDIEGEEIYEKDIVEVELFDTIELYVVLWRNDFFCWAYLPIEYAKETLDGWGDAFESQLTYQHKPKKLGNIYEHQNLLR